MTSRGHRLASCAGPLADAYDAALLDLDGVVYRGTVAVAHAAESLLAAEAAGMRLTFVTNNASRTPAEVAAVLRAVGVDADAAEVATSAQAAARLLAHRLAPGAPVLVVGASGLRQAIADCGLTPVDSATARPAAVVQGFSAATTYAMLAEAAIAVRAGAIWVATNLDATIPTPRGLLPGNGALVAAVSFATGSTPLVVGKPQRPLHDEAVRRTGAMRPLVVGDRLDTDIDGAIAVGADSLLVLTGVTSMLDLLRAPAGGRPSYVGADLRALVEAQPPVDVDGGVARCGPATAVVDNGVVVIDGGGSLTCGIRAGCAAGWSAVDAGAAVTAIGGTLAAELEGGPGADRSDRFGEDSTTRKSVLGAGSRRGPQTLGSAMVRESVKNYLALASGLTELTRERAMSAAEALVAQGEAAKDQVTALAEELLVSSKSNREAIAAMVRAEVDRTVTRLGVTKTDDVSALFRSVESALRETAAKAVDAVREIAVGMGLTEPPPAAAPPPQVRVAKKSARKTAGKKAAAKPAKTAAAEKPVKAAKTAAPAKAAKTAAPAKGAKAAKVARKPARQGP